MAAAAKRIHSQEKRDDEVQPALAKRCKYYYCYSDKNCCPNNCSVFLLFLESGSALTLGQDNYPKCVQSTVYVLKIAANKGDNLKLIEKP